MTAMNYGLADLLEELEQAGELVRVEAEVDPVLEVAEVTDRAAEAGAGALLFGAVRGHDLPVLTHLLAHPRRICRALGAGGLDELSLRVAEAVSPTQPEGWLEKLKSLPGRKALKGLAPRSVKTGVCQQVVRLGGDVDLGRLPALKSRPDEAARAITAGQVASVEPDSDERVVGRYDLQVLDRNRLAVCWDATDEHARLLGQYRRRGQRMPLAVVLGGDPAALLAAMAPLPPGADAWAVAGLLRAKPLELVAGRSAGLAVPADAEIVLEGYVDPAEPPVEAGPLSTPAGYYTRPRPAPVVHVTGLTHRANPIYPAMVPGTPPNEMTVAGRALVQVFLPLVKLAIPELVDCEVPQFGSARHWAFVSVRKTYAGQARQVAGAVWALRPAMFSKVLVVVDEHVDVHDAEEVWYAVATSADPARDVFFADGPPDPLDPAAAPDALGRRMAIDATIKLPEERRGPAAQPALMSEEIRQLVAGRWAEYGIDD